MRLKVAIVRKKLLAGQGESERVGHGAQKLSVWAAGSSDRVGRMGRF